MPGLLNHITGTLININFQIDSENDNLLGTIKLPRNLGQISARLPKSQYNLIKRANSLTQEDDNESIPDVKRRRSLIIAA